MRDKKIYCPTKLRGFQKHLFKSLQENYEIELNERLYFEKISFKKKILSKLIRTRIMDLLGIIQTIKVKKECDLVFSYNRFINNKDYIINLENPTALYHYSLRRNKTFLGKRKLKKELSNDNLKKIICISKACFNTASKLLNNEINREKLLQIYPCIEDKKILIEDLQKKSYRETLKLLFISSEFYLKSGKEILESFKLLSDHKIELTIITDIKKLKKDDLEEIKNNKKIRLLEFNLKFEELEKIYENSNILLHPTRQDSFALVILEALKNGIPCIGTDIYAIPEMIEDGKNGFLTEPKFLFFEKNNLPNPKVWNNREKTIYSEYCDEKIVTFLKENILKYFKDRNLLFEHSKNSYFKSINEDFSSEKIKIKWLKLLKEILY